MPTQTQKVIVDIETKANSSKGAIDSLKKSYTEFNSALDVLQKYLGGVSKLVDFTVGDFMRQAQAVRELALATQTSNEETSRLIQVMDDAGIATEKTKTAMLAMNEAGITPTIDNLAKMADEYRAIEDPLKRNEYLTDRLGNRGIEVAKVFEMEGAAIKAAAANVNESLIFDDKKIAAAEELRIAQDNLNDSITALKNDAIAPLIPMLADGAEGLQNFAGAMEYTDDIMIGLTKKAPALMSFIKGFSNLGVTADDVSDKLQEAADANEALHEAVRKNEEALNRVSFSTEEAGERYYELGQRALEYSRSGETLNAMLASQKRAIDAVSYAVSGQLGKAYKDFGTTTRELEVRAGALRAEMELAIKQGYSPTGQKVTELKNELDSLNGEYTDALTAMQNTTAELIYQQAAASGLAAGPLLELGRSLGLVSENDYNLITATQLLNDKFADQSDPEGYNAAMVALYDAAKDGVLTLDEINKLMQSLDGKVSNSQINVHTNYTSSGQPPSGSGSAYGPGTGSGNPPPGAVNPVGPNPGQLAPTGPPGDAVRTGFDSGGGGGLYIAPGAIVINGAGQSAEAIANMVLEKITKTAERERLSGKGRY